ncbi:phytanoyl-CoA dioxygenase family protein [Granulicella cerasi]|uniref:Phytanoyl-CoA dioxygenase family protein n=1 Tax=Granulicella cerasi TaxID=741063 RepID=A0ABW1ZBG4_9BACT|nr:phytanoyl-CoA dioxygenase family protein [Granulicella cerasi]
MGFETKDLAEYWERKTRHVSASDAATWVRDMTLLAGLGLNVREANLYLMQEQPSLEAFHAWVMERSGEWFDDTAVERVRAAMRGEVVGAPLSLEGVEGLSEEDLAHCDEHGYVVLRGAISEEDARDSEAAVYEQLKMDPNDAESWYGAELGHTIWVPLLRHAALVKNRRSAKVAKAFAQLWGREDLWATVDQAGFNPPEREGWPFPGPHLHWDTTLAEPHHFGVQGVLYLVDVAEDQGAFCCVPGFHRSLGDWLKRVPAGDDVREYAKRSLTSELMPVAAKRGDLVLWHQSLPHASSANRAERPRVVQYMSMWPTSFAHNTEWA